SLPNFSISNLKPCDLVTFILLATNAFYTAICRFSGRLPPSFLSKALSIVALICMKQIEKQYEYVWWRAQLGGAQHANFKSGDTLTELYK
ncbi:hypothetical protein, partial [Vibrio sp. Vb0304]|uniref:hypothetical protein n=1 Tax=Vibrio sp. Vb0304 TaxID=3074623 RepID=UPI0029654F66